MSEVHVLLKRFYLALFDDGLTLETLKLVYIGNLHSNFSYGFEISTSLSKEDSRLYFRCAKYTDTHTQQNVCKHICLIYNIPNTNRNTHTCKLPQLRTMILDYLNEDVCPQFEMCPRSYGRLLKYMSMLGGSYRHTCSTCIYVWVFMNVSQLNYYCTDVSCWPILWYKFSITFP